MRVTLSSVGLGLSLVAALALTPSCIGEAPGAVAGGPSAVGPSNVDGGAEASAPTTDAESDVMAPSMTVDSGPVQPPYAAATDSTMLAYFRFEDPPMSLAVSDASNHLAPGMLAGNATFALGKIGNGLHFDADGWINAGMIPAVADWTIALWVRPDVIENERTAFDMNYSEGFAAGPIGPRLSHEAAGLTLEVGTGAYMNMQSVKIVVASKSTPAEWHHVVATWTANKLTAYYDGAPAGSSPDLQPPTAFGNIQLGRGKGDQVQTRYKGFIDDVRVYGRALEAAEVAEVFQGKR